MKEYFTLEESLAFLNKDLDTLEKIGLRDLLFYASDFRLTPCFYYSGSVIWNEEGENYNSIKGYIDFDFQCHLKHPALGIDLFKSFLRKQNYIFIDFAESYDWNFHLISDAKTVYLLSADQEEILRRQYRSLDRIECDDESFLAFLFSHNSHQIFFDDVFFHKKELLKLKQKSCSNDNTNTASENTFQNLSHEHQIEKLLHTRTANNVSKIISALCELQQLDITKPYGEANKIIRKTLDQIGCSLSKEVVADWLKLAHENTK